MRFKQLGQTGLVGLSLLAIAACSNSTPVSSSPEATTTAATPMVIELTQTGCQFLETEAQDYGYTPTQGSDCVQINGETLSDREAGFKPLTLAAGTYIFRVKNDDVPYELGFYVRGQGLGQATLPKVSGGGLTAGTVQDYEITLKPGEYVFSCPLNPTPNYPLVVQ